MATTALHDRIRAVVEERLRLARAATIGPWAVHPSGEVYWPGGERTIKYGGGRTGIDEWFVTSDSEGRGAVADDDAAFIAANDPADAILSAEHALSVLERHKPYWFDLGGQHCDTCGFRANPELAWPCDEIRALATRWRVEVDG